MLDDDIEYKEVNPGPKISREIQDKFLTYLKANLQKEDTLIISGSFSRGIKSSYLVEIAQITSEIGTQLVIDSSDSQVLDTLKYHPYLLKPNDAELASFFNINEKLSNQRVVELARKLISKGCQNVLVSLGENGAALINKDHAYFGNAPKIDVVNTAGAGDTMLGTYIGEKALGKDTKLALKTAIAAGSDTASRTGLSDFELDDLLKKIVIKERND